ncbi:MAG: FKBP-type peptidyl-prolyl cis-trans isomerase [Fibrobacter sp.]|nr:FKBP-type peptidyl-prolyl cis-trans isomerase [Fibrobacter sp.]
MNKKVIVAAGALALLLTGCDQLCQGPKTKTALVTEKDKYSYALGAHFGNQAQFQLVARDSIDLDLDLFIQAFVERYKQDSAKYLMADSTIFQTLTELSQSRQAEKARKDSVAAAENKAKGEAFLAQNKTAEGVVTTESGLQYKVITEGTGATPSDTDVVKVHYTGTLLDGTKFDSSVDRGEPLEFPIGAVIPGWTEMLKLMKVGEKVTAWIPSDLAYGPRGRGPQIPGNSMLIFEMELIDTHAPGAPSNAIAAAEPAKEEAKAEPAKAEAKPAEKAAPAAAPAAAKAEAKPAAPAAKAAPAAAPAAKAEAKPAAAAPAAKPAAAAPAAKPAAAAPAAKPAAAPAAAPAAPAAKPAAAAPAAAPAAKPAAAPAAAPAAPAAKPAAAAPAAAPAAKPEAKPAAAAPAAAQ